MRAAALAGILLLASCAAPPVPQPITPSARPQRVVSLNLCADQLLVPLADRDQIAALNMNARDRWMSAVAAQARGHRLIRGSAEEVLALAPDLIVGAPAFRTDALRRMSGRAYPALELPPANSYAEIRAQIGELASALGHPDRGHRLVARMDAALAGMKAMGRGRVAAYYQRRGYLTGTGTLVDALMTRAGLVNIAAKLGKPALSRLSLEQIIAARPDVLIVEEDSQALDDQGAQMLQHTALRHIPRIVLPQAWTVCGGPAFVDAAASLNAQLAALPDPRT
ncbi:iron ABC transporter [Sphingomonas turrisvirgatae]|uniref:Iron ABC transporter n=1 Tax=Sphingomonas turrisvirgatae TaxID=1888892 RepID=A0A1E3LY15_9SPHN|nr:iron ABC transporter [Sphingomonas turrisvirgatae]